MSNNVPKFTNEKVAIVAESRVAESAAAVGDAPVVNAVAIAVMASSMLSAALPTLADDWKEANVDTRVEYWDTSVVSAFLTCV